jgi:hypothetical protein
MNMFETSDILEFQKFQSGLYRPEDKILQVFTVSFLFVPMFYDFFHSIVTEQEIKQLFEFVLIEHGPNYVSLRTSCAVTDKAVAAETATASAPPPTERPKVTAVATRACERLSVMAKRRSIPQLDGCLSPSDSSFEAFSPAPAPPAPAHPAPAPPDHAHPDSAPPDHAHPAPAPPAPVHPVLAPPDHAHPAQAPPDPASPALTTPGQAPAPPPGYILCNICRLRHHDWVYCRCKHCKV